MSVPFNTADFLEASLRQAAKALPEFFPEPLAPMLQVADPRFGDFQANGILPYAKKQKQNPRMLGEKLAGAVRAVLEPIVTIEVSGPGFLNFKLQPDYLLRWLRAYPDAKAYHEAAAVELKGKTIVVDYSSPNTAKQLHVGHIRSMVIGDAIQRLLQFFGANIIRDNHLGDWGTQFGILLWIIKKKQHVFNVQDPESALVEVEALYKEGSAKVQEAPENLEAARQELVKLQQGDPTNLALWETINRVSYGSFQKIYDALGIRFDHVLGESFYRDQVDAVCKELESHNIAESNQGALVVFHRDHPRFKEQPFIIRKSDGASNYGTTDLATVLYRQKEWQADGCIYVTDGRQQDHFQQLFLTTKKWFAATNRPLPELRHVWFGTILGEDGKAIKTRSGESIKLKDLLEEGIQRARKIVEEKNADLSAGEKDHIARVIGLSAVKYADLVQCRTSDYIFSWDKLLSLEGNTAPYLLYAIARIHAIFRKAATPLEEKDVATLETPSERQLASKLLAFPVVLVYGLRDLYPHYLCAYLYELAGVFSSFYNADKVLSEDPKIRNRRLFLCARTLQTLETGLRLLGIETLERM